jgi:hypothetical protein
MKKLFNKVFSNNHSIAVNTFLFTICLMLLYLLVFLPLIVYVFIQNPQIFNEAEADIYLNTSELYQFGSKLELYGTFVSGGALCELVRRTRSLKIGLLNDKMFVSYVFIIAGLIMDIAGYLLMIYC